MALDEAAIEMSTREIVARLEEELMGLGSALSTIGLVYEPVRDAAKGYRDAAAPGEPPIDGFVHLGRTRENTADGKVERDVWVDSDHVVQLETFASRFARGTYRLITFFADGSVIETLAGGMHAKTIGRLTRRGGTNNPLADFETHAEAVRVQTIAYETKALYVADIDVACLLGRYYHRHVR